MNGTSSGERGDGHGRNVVLVTIDSLRADHCGPYDPPSDAEWSGSLTPTLDALAADGVVFERTIAPGPRTPSSMPVAFTGEPLSTRGVYRDGIEKTERWEERRRRIRRHMHRHRPIAERFADLGYDTAAVTANPWTTTDTGFDVGFDKFVAVGESIEIEPSGLVATAIDRFTDVRRNGWFLTWPDFYDQVERVRATLSEPYLLWVFLLDPHQPYLAPARFREEISALGMYYSNFRYNRFHGYVDDLPPHLHAGLQRSYHDAIRSADGFLDRFLSDVEDDPVVCVHADHGEAFAEHGFYSHRLQLYEENVRVPLVLSNADATGRVSEPTSLAALPTLLTDAATGTLTPERYGRPYVHASTEEGERVAVRGRDWKYVRGGGDWPYVMAASGEELYDLASDPDEQTNLAAERTDATRLLEHLVERRELDVTERQLIAAAAGGLEST